MSKSTAAIGESRRQIVHRTRGLRHGAITRLMSPSDFGHILKPFVFLDLFDIDGPSFSGMALHPARVLVQAEERCRAESRVESIYQAPEAFSDTDPLSNC